MNTPDQFLDKSFDKADNYLGFDRSRVTEVASELNHLLSNYNVYYQNLRNFHWNISGENFFELHRQFEDLYNDARLKIDEIAERILTLRHRPLSRMTDYLEISEIEEATLVEGDRTMVLTVLKNHSILIKKMRVIIEKAGDLKDEGTVDMIGSFLESMEKKSWMLDAWATRKVKMVTA